MFRKEPASLAHALSLTFCSPLRAFRVEPSSGVSCCGLHLTFSHSPKERDAAEIWSTWSNDALKIMRCCERRMNGEREEGGSGRRASATDRRLAAVGSKLEEGNNRAASARHAHPLQSKLSGRRDAGVLSTNAGKTIGRPTWLTCLSRPRSPRSRSQRGRFSMRCYPSPRGLLGAGRYATSTSTRLAEQSRII